MTHQPGATPTTIPEMLSTRQKALGATDAAIASALGYTSETVVQMLKDGRMRLPLNKAQDFARALDLDARDVLRAIDPQVVAIVEQCFGPLMLSPAEGRLISALRHAAQGRDLAPIVFEKDAFIALVVAGERGQA